MARLGVAIGAAFAFGMLAGPFLAHQFGVRFLFWATSVLSMTAAIYLLIAIPAPKHLRPEEHLHAGDLQAILRQKPMVFLDLGTYVLHTAVTILFVLVPFDLTRRTGLHEVWKVAVPAIVVGLGSMVLTARLSDRENRGRIVLYVGSGLLLASSLVFAFAAPTAASIIGGTTVFVLGVALLEPALPSRMTHFAVGRHRGTAMGIFHMSQFLGTFTGGLLGGVFLQRDRLPLHLGLAAAFLAWMLTIPQIEERPRIHPV
jgi:predicted MFS family arabinose efflux permease